MKNEPFIGKINIGHGTVPYFKAGSGDRNFVMIPGVGLKSAVPMAPAITALFESFLEKYTIWLFDRIEGLPDGYSVRDMAEDEAMAMEKAGITNADVLGNSMGGMIGIVLAAEHPELVRRMMLASTIPCQNRVSRATFDRWVKLGEGDDVVALNRDYYKKVYSRDYYNRFKTAIQAIEKDGTPEEMRCFAVQAGACRWFDGREELKKIQAKVMVTGVWHDRVLSGKGAVQIA